HQIAAFDVALDGQALVAGDDHELPAFAYIRPQLVPERFGRVAGVRAGILDAQHADHLELANAVDDWRLSRLGVRVFDNRATVANANLVGADDKTPELALADVGRLPEVSRLRKLGRGLALGDRQDVSRRADAEGAVVGVVELEPVAGREAELDLM